jgi:hypothetical protein
MDKKLTLPTFLGIGVQRGGTTWLHTLLSSHPDVYMPGRRKEIRFFEKYYDRGLAWYSDFFCAPEEAARYQAIGEISTQYYDDAEAPRRIFMTLPQVKLIIMLRHPVSRAYSHYGFVVQRRNYRGSFESFLKTRPKALEKGYYSRYMQNYLQYFDRSQILALVFEEVFSDIEKSKERVADFLSIDVGKFPAAAGSEKVNASVVPSQQSLYGLMVKTGRRLRKHNLEPLVDLVMRMGIQRAFSKGSKLQPLDEGMRKDLSRSYLAEFDDLERCLQLDLSAWRS